MHSKTVVVGSAVGLHARPAAIISQAAEELGSEVLIGVPGGAGVDASSALMIMTLGAGNGATVEVSGEVAADVEAIAALVEQDLDAEDAPGAAAL
jgi:phosphocarrier protein